MPDSSEVGTSPDSGGDEIGGLRAMIDTVFAGIPDMAAIVAPDRTVMRSNLGGGTAGRSCHETFFGSKEPCSGCLLPRLLDEKGPVKADVVRGDMHFEIRARPMLGRDGSVESFFEFCREVTFRKSYEQQLQFADRMASLGQMVLGIGHEINNPNQFIRGNVKILKQALEDMLPVVDAYAATHPELKIANLKYDFFREHILVLVGDMSNGSERIKKVVDAIKSFAREDVGTLTDEVDVNTVITESARLVYHQFRKTADVDLRLAPDLPTFPGSAQKIGQVIINLLINAGQAMPDHSKGMIRVTTGLHEGRFVEVRVSDDGVGMPEGVLKNIFEPFFTTKLSKGGTGLGLSIAAGIMELHKGSISVESQAGKGTTFTLRFPLKGGAGS